MNFRIPDRKRAIRKRMAQEAIDTARGLTLLKLWNSEERLEVYFVKQGYVRGRGESIMEFLARALDLGMDDLRRFLTEVVAGEHPRKFSRTGFDKKPDPQFYTAIAAMYLCMEAEAAQ